MPPPTTAPTPGVPGPHDRSRPVAPSPQDALGVGIVAAVGLTFLFRYLTVDFTNDHFTHLSRARQILFGELPIRDFFDPGQFLHYWFSVAAQVLFGYNLFGEALLTVGFIAVSAGLTFVLASRFSGSRWVGAGATLLAVVSLPRLYNYPKAFLYIAAIYLAWRHAHRQGRFGIATLALASAVSFLFRYDHGAYITVMMLVFLTVLHGDRLRSWFAAIGAFAGLLCVMLLPFALYVEWATGVYAYVTSSERPVSMVAGSVRRYRPPEFDFDGSAPILAVQPVGSEGQGSGDDPAAEAGDPTFWQTVDRYVPLARLHLATRVHATQCACLVLLRDTRCAVGHPCAGRGSVVEGPDRSARGGADGCPRVRRRGHQPRARWLHPRHAPGRCRNADLRDWRLGGRPVAG